MELKPGDKVIMNGVYEVSDQDVGKIYTVACEPWFCCGTKIVSLEGRHGAYAVDGLTKIEVGKLG